MSTILTDKYQTKKNLVFNFITFFVNAVIGIWLPPYLIRKLGVDAYGLIPISMSITSVMLLITISINGTLSRFLSIDFETDTLSANKTFNTAFFSLLILICCLLPFCVAFSFMSDKFLTIPKRVVNDSVLLFLAVLLAFLINTFSSLYNSVAFVKNRIDLRNGSVIITRATTLLFLIIFFYFGFIRIQVFGIATLLGTIIGLAYSYHIFKKFSAEISLNFKFFDKHQLKRMASLGFWLVVNQVGVLLFLQTDIIVVNHFKGAESSGIYATLLQWSFLIRTLVGIVSGVLEPLSLNLFAKKLFDQLKQLTVFSTKILGLFTVFISSIIIYFSHDILFIWLGESFLPYRWIFILILIHLGPNLSVGSIVNINIAYHKVKIPGYVALGTGLLNVILGMLLLIYTDLGLYSIAIAGLVSLTLKSFIFTPFYAAKIMSLPVMTYYKPIVPSIILSLSVLALTFLFPSMNLNIGHSYLKLILYIGLFSGLLTLIIYKIFLNRKDRSQLMSLVFSRIKK